MCTIVHGGNLQPGQSGREKRDCAGAQLKSIVFTIENISPRYIRIDSYTKREERTIFILNRRVYPAFLSVALSTTPFINVSGPKFS